MSTRFQVPMLNLPALAALLALAAIAPGPAFAKRATTSDPAYGYAHQPHPRGANLPSPAPWGSAPRAGSPFETDPDPRIRFEMNRDDHDRRLGGS